MDRRNTGALANQKIKAVFDRKKVKANQKNPTILSLARTGIKVRDISNGEGQIAADYTNYNLVEPNDLLLNPMDLVSGDNCNISTVYGVISPAYINLVSKPGTNPRFFNYYFKSQYWLGAFFAYGKGVSFDNRWTLNDETLKNYLVVTPSYSEQEKIANFLDKQTSLIDNIIEDTKQSIEELKQYKKSLITETVIKGLNGNIGRKDSGVEWIGETPEVWTVIKIKYLLRESNKKSTVGDEEPLSMSQKVGIIPSKLMDKIPNPPSSYVGNKLVSKGALVFNKLKAHLGVFSVSNYEGIVSPDYAVYYSTDKVEAKFLELLFKTPQCITEFQRNSRGVGQGLTRLYTHEFFNIKVSIPDIDTQKEIVLFINEKVNSINNLIEEKERLISEHEMYKKSMIYEYVTGKKGVL